MSDDLAGAIQTLRRILWSGREFGLAGVLVGAGFSRNALRLDGSPAQPPSGDRLASELVDRLAPGAGVPSKTDPLPEIAQWFESQHGRDALTLLLHELIADEEMRPGPLHRALLECPWSDVFTTNYDTLLERSALEVIDKKYECVDRREALSGSARPRIVKMHGTLVAGGDEPLVTRTDYAKFETARPHIVSTFKQALLENEAVVLLGYSANDTNVDWVIQRAKTIVGRLPQIFLCGVLDADDGQRDFYASMGITAVDLGPLFPSDSSADSSRHQRALSWFIKNLSIKDRPDAWTWPSSLVSGGANSPEFPALVPASCELPPSPRLMPAHEVSSEEIAQLLGTWKSERELYPGWVVCPQQNRERLWAETEYWLRPLVEYCKREDLEESLVVAREITWRLKTCLMMIDPEFVEAFLPLAEQGLVTQHGAIQECALQVALELLRGYREAADHDSFERMFSLLTPHASAAVLQDMRLERARLSMQALDFPGAEIEIDAWLADSGKDAGFALSRAASMMSELGRLDDAAEMVTSCVTNLRALEDAYMPDHALLSGEAWSLLLSMNVERGRSLDVDTAPYRSRFEQLARYRCDPWREKSSLAAEVISHSNVQESESIAFDPDRVNVSSSIRWSAQHYTDAETLGTQYLRLLDDGACTLRAGFVGTDNPSAMAAAESAIGTSAFRVLSLAVRLGNKDFASRWLTRLRVSSIGDEEFSKIWSCQAAYVRWSAGLLGGEHPRATTGLQSALEIMARLAIRADRDQVSEALGLALDLAATSSGWLEVLRPSVSALLERATVALSEPDLSSLVRQFLAAGLPGDGTPDFLMPLWHGGRHLPSLRGSISGTVSSLIDAGACDQTALRAASLDRLAFLEAMHALEPSEQDRFGHVLWGQLDDEGIPSGTGMRCPQLLYLPSPDRVTTVERVRHHLRRGLTPVVSVSRTDNGKISRSVGYPPAASRELHDLHWATKPRFPYGGDSAWQLDWTQSEAESIVAEVHRWLRDDILPNRDMLTDSGMGLSFENEFESLDHVLADVTLRYLGEITPETGRILSDLVEQLDAMGLPSFACQVELLRLGVGDAARLEGRLRIGMSAGSRAHMANAHDAVTRWALLGGSDSTPDMPLSLLADTGREIQLVALPGLKYALETCALVARRRPGLLTDDVMGSLVAGLRFLLPATDLAPVSPPGRVPHEMRPNLRLSAMRLARALVPQLEGDDIGVQLLDSWKLAGLESNLPELRAVWADDPEAD